MSLNTYGGSAWAFRELMRLASEEIKAGDGELKPARVIHKFAHPKRTLIGRFQARLLRIARTK